MNSNNLSYRSDIDGLRALAILPVILFHAFPGGLPGGFIGVDIFFVISGFLITSILLKDISNHAFSIRTFYARRVRRIFPALGLVLLFCLGIGWIVLTAGEYQNLGKHTAWGAGFIANFVFWKEAGYFDAAADTKPLLHLWSLGIEEQFYIVWPLLLYFLAKRKWNILFAILTLASFSFGLNIWRIHTDPTGTFYSPLTRSWELAVGALIAYQATSPIQKVNHFFRQYETAISFLGLCFILMGFLFIHEGRGFPGYWALLPSFGAAFLIIAGPKAFVNRSLLSSRLAVFFGLISFPLYLWHWPLLSFARIIYSEIPPVDIRVFLLGLSIFLAWLTYLFLEKPIRHSNDALQKSTRKNMTKFLVVILIAIGVVGHITNKSKGFPFRQFGLFNADPATLAMGEDRFRLKKECGLNQNESKLFQSCWTDPKGIPRLVVIGDSKGEALFYGLAREADPDQSWMMLGNMTPILAGDDPWDSQNERRTQLALSSVIKNKDIQVVLLGVALRSLFGVPELYTASQIEQSGKYQSTLDGISKTIHTLKQNQKKIVFLIDHPPFPDPKSCISGGLTNNEFLNKIFYRKLNPRCSISYEQYRIDSARYYKWVEDLKQRHPDILVYDPSSLLCDLANNRCDISMNGKFLYSYGDHLSDYANSLIARDLLPKISGMIQK